MREFHSIRFKINHRFASKMFSIEQAKSATIQVKSTEMSAELETTVKTLARDVVIWNANDM